MTGRLTIVAPDVLEGSGLLYRDDPPPMRPAFPDPSTTLVYRPGARQSVRYDAADALRQLRSALGIDTPATLTAAAVGTAPPSPQVAVSDRLMDVRRPGCRYYAGTGRTLEELQRDCSDLEVWLGLDASTAETAAYLSLALDGHRVHELLRRSTYAVRRARHWRQAQDTLGVSVGKVKSLVQLSEMAQQCRLLLLELEGLVRGYRVVHPALDEAAIRRANVQILETSASDAFVCQLKLFADAIRTFSGQVHHSGETLERNVEAMNQRCEKLLALSKQIAEQEHL